MLAAQLLGRHPGFRFIEDPPDLMTLPPKTGPGEMSGIFGLGRTHGKEAVHPRTGDQQWPHRALAYRTPTIALRLVMYASTGQSKTLCDLISHTPIEGWCPDGPERQRTPRCFPNGATRLPASH